MSTKTQKPNSSSRARLIAGVALIAALYGGYRLYQARRPYEWSGTVEARTVSVGSRVGGRVQQVLAREGDAVKANQVIVTLEPGDLPAQLGQAEAEVAERQANLEKLEKGARPEELAAAHARALSAKAALAQALAGSRPEQIAAAEARLAAQEIAVQKAKLDSDRMHKLDQSGAAVPAELDNIDLSLRAATAQRDATKQQLEELKNGSRREEVLQAQAREMEQAASEKLVSSGTRVEDLKAARAQVDRALARVAQIQTSIDELSIHAPVDSRVEALDLRTGDILAPNATAAVLLEEGQLYVRIYVPETLLGHLAVGQSVNIGVDSFPDTTFHGITEHINQVGEYSPRNLQTADERADQVFATRIGLKTGLEQLRAGMAAFIQVPK
jgi:multidrug resistance efflux pump